MAAVLFLAGFQIVDVKLAFAAIRALHLDLFRPDAVAVRDGP
jgi:hypothetical protein